MKFTNLRGGSSWRAPSGIPTTVPDPLSPAMIAKRIDGALEHGKFYTLAAQEAYADLVALSEQLKAIPNRITP